MVHGHGTAFGGLAAALICRKCRRTTTSDRRLDERVEFFVTTDGELKVTRSDTLHFKILGSVTGKFQNLSGKVLKNGSRVYGSRGTNTPL